MWGPSTSDCSHQIIIHPSPPVSLGLKLLPTHPSQVQDLSAACSRLEDANLQLEGARDAAAQSWAGLQRGSETLMGQLREAEGQWARSVGQISRRGPGGKVRWSERGRTLQSN